MRKDPVWVSFKGVKSSAIGFRLAQLPDRPLAEQKAKTQSVPNRNGDLVITEDAYKDVDIKVTLQAVSEYEYQSFYDYLRVRDHPKYSDFVNEQPPVRQSADYTAFGEWLKGRGELVFSDMEFSETGEETPNAYAYTGQVIKAIPNHHKRNAYGVEAYDITFHCEPLKHLRREEQLEFTSVPAYNFDGYGNVPSRPLITLEGSGEATLNINRYELLISNIDGYVTIDCETMMAFKGDVNKSHTVTIMDGDNLEDDFPTLYTTKRADGEGNYISWTSGISKVTIEPRWRWR